MKKRLPFLLLSIGLNAQFNLQTIIKYSDGSFIMNIDMKLKFSAMYQPSTSTPVFLRNTIY